MAERAAAQMALHFPSAPDVWIWHGNKNDGYSTIPRTLPIAMQVIDSMSKGQPAGHTLFCLWARSPDHPLITIENPATFAGEAGFSGVRAVDTWRRRMKILLNLRFIEAKPGTSGAFHYVLLLNPNAAVEKMRAEGQIQDGLYARFIDRVAEVGAMGDVEALHEYWEGQARLTEHENRASEKAPPPPKSANKETAIAKKKVPVKKKPTPKAS